MGTIAVSDPARRMPYRKRGQSPIVAAQHLLALSIGSQKGPRIGVQKGPQGPSFCSVQQRHPSVPAHATAEPARATAVKNGRFWRPPAGLVLEGREHDGMMRAPGGVLDVRRGV